MLRSEEEEEEEEEEERKKANGAAQDKNEGPRTLMVPLNSQKWGPSRNDGGQENKTLMVHPWAKRKWVAETSPLLLLKEVPNFGNICIYYLPFLKKVNLVINNPSFLPR